MLQKLYTKTVSGAPILLIRDTQAGIYANGVPILIVRREASGIALIGDGDVHVISRDDYNRLLALPNSTAPFEQGS